MACWLILNWSLQGAFSADRMKKSPVQWAPSSNAIPNTTNGDGRKSALKRASCPRCDRPCPIPARRWAQVSIARRSPGFRAGGTAVAGSYVFRDAHASQGHSIGTAYFGRSTGAAPKEAPRSFRVSSGRLVSIALSTLASDLAELQSHSRAAALLETSNCYCRPDRTAGELPLH